MPVQRLEDERAVLEELARLAGSADDIEIEEDHAYLRPGLPREVLRKLRRVHWVVQDELDLHGLTGDEAALATARFLAESVRGGFAACASSTARAWGRATASPCSRAASASSSRASPRCSPSPSRRQPTAAAAP